MSDHHSTSLAVDRERPPHQRDGFFDVVRAVATIRVVLWHAFSAPALTWVVAAMPAMFFVSGHLFARSATRRSAGRVSWDRLRRIGPPLWLFAACAWIAMTIAASRTGEALDWSRVVWWLVPVADPAGSSWEGGWLSSHLWYLRALLWLLVAAPALWWAVRRRPALVAGSLVVAVGAIEAADRAGWLRPAWNTQLVWQLGDAALYGFFFAVGMWSASGTLERVRRRWWVLVAAACTVGAVVWAWTQPGFDGIVNDSHPLHLLVGSAWLAVALAARGQLARLASWRPTAPVVRFSGQRALSIYLWHTAAILVAVEVLARLGELAGPVWVAAYAAVIVAGTLTAVGVIGFVEDLAAGRRARVWPSRQPLSWRGLAWRLTPGLAVGAVAAVILVVPTVGVGPTSGSEAASFRPRVPSQAPKAPVLADGAVASGLVTGSAPLELASATPPARFDAGVLQSLVDTWRSEVGETGVVVSVTDPAGGSWLGASGSWADGRPREADEVVDTASVTKLFTANLVLREIDAGRMSLDDPIESVPGASVPFPLAGQVTLADLLAHRAGLANYRDVVAGSDEVAGDGQVDPPSVVASTLDAVFSAPLEAPPGATSYSSTNYLVVGQLLEAATGRSFDELLRSELLAPLELSRTQHLPSVPGEPRQGAAGLEAPLDELGRAGVALVRDHLGVSAESAARSRAIDPVSAIGPGTIGYCPCSVDDDGAMRWFGVGYAGGNVWLAWLPAYDLVLAVDVSDGLWATPGRMDEVTDLARWVAESVRGPVGGAGPRDDEPALAAGDDPQTPASAAPDPSTEAPVDVPAPGEEEVPPPV